MDPATVGSIVGALIFIMIKYALMKDVKFKSKNRVLFPQSLWTTQ